MRCSRVQRYLSAATSRVYHAGASAYPDMQLFTSALSHCVQVCNGAGYMRREVMAVRNSRLTFATAGKKVMQTPFSPSAAGEFMGEASCRVTQCWRKSGRRKYVS